jgi:hypothetical protein
VARGRLCASGARRAAGPDGFTGSSCRSRPVHVVRDVSLLRLYRRGRIRVASLISSGQSRVESGFIRIDLAPMRRQPWNCKEAAKLRCNSIRFHRERRPIDMFWIIAIALVAIVALAVVGFVLHLLLSPWLLVAAIGILAWLKLRPRRSRL